MKKTVCMLSTVVAALCVSATDVQLLVQKVDNQGLVPGNTYRLYAQVLDQNKNIHAIFGDTENPLSITSTANFYQHPFGGYSTASVNPAAIEAEPALNFDSWITLGYANSIENDVWDIGLTFADFNSGGSINTENGAWFLLPTDEKCEANDLGLILLGQFTTTGIASGVLNVQGWDGPNNNWQARNLQFTTENANVFGCNDQSASNYNPQATFNDGSCILDGNSGINAAHGHDVAPSKITDAANSWDVFPNPIRDNVFHIQFRNDIDFNEGNVVVEIMEMNGKLVRSFEVNSGMVIGGNRISVDQPLAAGMYKVMLTQAGKQESKSIVVGK
jgi:hypothetical protein